MVDWQATAITIYCDAIGDEVTIIVYKDWSVKCTGCMNDDQIGGRSGRLVRRGKRTSKRQTKCLGPQCKQVTEYRDKLHSQELRKGAIN